MSKPVKVDIQIPGQKATLACYCLPEATIASVKRWLTQQLEGLQVDSFYFTFGAANYARADDWTIAQVQAKTSSPHLFFRVVYRTPKVCPLVMYS